MSGRDLAETDGGDNSLLNSSAQFVQDQALTDQGLEQGENITQQFLDASIDELRKEFLENNATNSIDTSILDDIRNAESFGLKNVYIENTATGPIKAEELLSQMTISESSSESPSLWSKEFLDLMKAKRGKSYPNSGCSNNQMPIEYKPFSSGYDNEIVNEGQVDKHDKNAAYKNKATKMRKNVSTPTTGHGHKTLKMCPHLKHAPSVPDFIEYYPKKRHGRRKATYVPTIMVDGILNEEFNRQSLYSMLPPTPEISTNVTPNEELNTMLPPTPDISTKVTPNKELNTMSAPSTSGISTRKLSNEAPNQPPRELQGNALMDRMAKSFFDTLCTKLVLSTKLSSAFENRRAKKLHELKRGREMLKQPKLKDLLVNCKAPNMSGKGTKDKYIVKNVDGQIRCFERMAIGLKQDYDFVPDNIMDSIESPLVEGKRRLENGEFPIAVLCFEVVVKQDPSNAEAWQLLGTTQSDNEQDALAIVALNKCLELQPDNLSAILDLAACHANKYDLVEAFRTLLEWLKKNPKYSDIVESTPEGDNFLQHHKDSPILIMFRYMEALKLYDYVHEILTKAAQRNSAADNVDADVQNCLGILYGGVEENAKAIECFKAALNIRPKDARLWNRLGEILVNDSQYEEALLAYYNALTFCPGLLRTRYNLGVTCHQLGTIKAAITHYVDVLNQQAVAVSTSSEYLKKPILSDNVWTALRSVIVESEQPDLYFAVKDRKLDALNAFVQDDKVNE